ncbi:MAG: hypothetical protein WC796_04515 [Candidatus Pacearchaeota archaeon]|jgi:hypothetical protein
MPKLKKVDFDKQFRFREARENDSRRGLVNRVNCTNCVHTACEPRPDKGKIGEHNEKDNFCDHPERLRRIKIAEYWDSGGMGRSYSHSHNLADVRVCDAYKSQPLPAGVTVPEIPKGQAVLLSSQNADPYHADPNCPYVIEEARMLADGTNHNALFRRPEIRVVDISDMVPGETIRDICEMSCCESKLPFQLIGNPNGYRSRAGIKPDGSEPIVWVRIVKDHKRKISMTIEEAEAALDLTRFTGPEFKTIHDEIIAASDHLHNTCNYLGSKPLSEAANPVVVHPHDFHLLEPLASDPFKPEFWLYDKRLFDPKRKDEFKGKPIRELEEIPEGFILCLDRERVLRFARTGERSDGPPYGHLMYGIVNPLIDESLINRGVTHCIDIRAVNYNGFNHWWGVFGKGFSKIASFDED